VSSPLRTSPFRGTALRDAGHRVDVPVALFTFAGAWLGGQLAVLVVLAIGGYTDADDVPIWTLFIGQLLVWSIFLVAMTLASNRDGSGHFVNDYQVRFKVVDALGIPIGVLSQLVVLPLIYKPLESIWEDVFTDDKLSENAKDLVDRASGGAMVLLVLMVCVGAPIVEEIVYRGLLQGSFAARFHNVPAWLVASAIFALIHFRPVEYPGLLAIGLICGYCAMSTGRLGMAMACHVGFNVTGLLLALD
jgi:membrane protease YdiL (CAAX protease family)